MRPLNPHPLPPELNAGHCLRGDICHEKNVVPSLDCAWTFPSRIQVLRLLLADCTRKNSDNLGVLPGRRRYLGNGLMSGVLVATGYQGAFKGLRSPPSTLHVPRSWDKPSSGSVSCYHSAVQRGKEPQAGNKSRNTSCLSHWLAQRSWPSHCISLCLSSPHL